MTEMINVLKRIRNNSQLTAYAHFGAAERMSKLHLWLGIPTALISVGLGSVLVADLQDKVPDLVKWSAGALSLIAALLSTFQTFFNPKEGKSKHREIANEYLSINRKTELVLAKSKDEVIDTVELSKNVSRLNEEYDSINKSAQDYPTNNADWNRAKSKFNGIKNRYNKSSQKDGKKTSASV